MMRMKRSIRRNITRRMRRGRREEESMESIHQYTLYI